MRKLAVLSCLLFLAFSATRAKAGTLDPRILIGEPSCGSWDSNIGPIFSLTGNTFTFTLDGIHGVYAFCNNSPATWTSLDLNVWNTGYIQSANDVFCDGGGVFGNCTATLTGNLLSIDFADCSTITNGNCGIKPNNNQNDESAHYFWINLYDQPCDPTKGDDCSNVPISWPKGLTFAGGLNNTPPPPLGSVPEPASLLLVGSGIVGAWRLRKRR